jgi:sulfite reductase (NADPH) flavoprotein alpha-component
MPMSTPTNSLNTKNLYDRLNPYHAPLLECRVLTKPGSSKEILHIICDLSNSSIEYEVGSSFAILPENSDEDANEILKKLGFDKKNLQILSKNGISSTFFDFLKKHANLSQISSQHFKLILKHKNSEEISKLIEDKVRLKTYTEEHSLSDFLNTYWDNSIEIQELVEITPPLLPRYYSTASSMKKVGPYAHFMVASFSYVKAGKIKESITASYLKRIPKGAKIRLFLQENPNFSLPSDSKTPIIMVGPGTGLACFRGFLQEREASHSTGKNWLFTGDRNRETDFHYGEELLDLEKRGLLKLSAAFSRDSEEKVYVQDLMWKEKGELWNWIHKEHAYIYISGDAKLMARDVQKTLIEIAMSELNCSEEEAKHYFKEMKSSKRLLLDVY